MNSSVYVISPQPSHFVHNPRGTETFWSPLPRSRGSFFRRHQAITAASHFPQRMPRLAAHHPPASMPWQDHCECRPTLLSHGVRQTPPNGEPTEIPHAGLSYRDAGVDIDAGNEAVRRIKSLVAQTRRPEQLDDIGGFAGMIGLPSGMAEPVLVSCTDGVGTKLLVAIAMQRHETVGIDLVAMCVNDLLVTGARPLFLLDYIACGSLQPGHIEQLVAGIVEGCKQSGCALLGGETAELPGMYAEGHYDLAAFSVGVVDRKRILKPAHTTAGDVVIGLPSSGLHSNGFSLARRALLDRNHGGLRFDSPLPNSGTTVGEAMLTPTRIYAESFAALQRDLGPALHAAAHITGGGLLENPQRSVTDDLAVHLDLGDVPQHPIFAAIQAQGVAQDEMWRTFNCGLGLLLYIDRAHCDAAISCLTAAGEQPLVVGTLEERAGADAPQVIMASN